MWPGGLTVPEGPPLEGGVLKEPRPPLGVLHRGVVKEEQQPQILSPHPLPPAPEVGVPEVGGHQLRHPPRDLPHLPRLLHRRGEALLHLHPVGDGELSPKHGLHHGLQEPLHRAGGGRRRRPPLPLPHGPTALHPPPHTHTATTANATTARQQNWENEADTTALKHTTFKWIFFKKIAHVGA